VPGHDEEKGKVKFNLTKEDWKIGDIVRVIEDWEAAIAGFLLCCRSCRLPSCRAVRAALVAEAMTK
jgi:hypothetical protein